MKKYLAVLFALCMILCCACGTAPVSEQTPAASGPEAAREDEPEQTVLPEPSEAPVTPSPDPVEKEEERNDEDSDEDGPNPAMELVGPYVCSGCSVFIETEGSKGVRASVTWSFSSNQLSEWSMTGTFDEKSLSFNYSDAVKLNYIYGDDGYITSTETVYEGGTGSFAFTGEGMLYWTDETEHIADGMMFAFSGGMMEQWGVS